MQLRYSEHFNINKKEFDDLGVFNGFILHDSLYFLNPKLIKETKNEFFLDSYNKLTKRFLNIISLIDKVKIPDKTKDIYFKAAVKAIKSKEMGYIGLGYSSAGKDGNGIGEILATSIASTCFKLIKLDVVEPELFELLGVFKEQIGVDRLSDMTIKIIQDDILKYTEYISTKLDLPVREYEKYKVAYNEYDNNNPLFFIPTSLLSKLPTWDNMFYETITDDKEILDFINLEFGKEYQKYLDKKEYREKAIIKNTKIIKDLIVKYKSSADTSYDFLTDPSNDFNWIDEILELVDNNPLTINKDEDIYIIVQTICNKFKYLLENTNAYKLLYHDGTRKKHESASQQAFQLFATSYCDANNLDISPESNGGRGPVDFKFSQGKEKVLVELKLSTSNDLIHCLETQIKIYKKSEGTNQSILLVLMVGTNENNAISKIEKLIKYKNELAKKEKYLPEIIDADALIKLSASKA